jgi:hypothetical protein
MNHKAMIERMLKDHPNQEGFKSIPREFFTSYLNMLNTLVLVEMISRGVGCATGETATLAPKTAEQIRNVIAEAAGCPEAPPHAVPNEAAYSGPTAEADKRQFLLDVMCTAIEGGITGWARARDIERTASEGDYLSFKVRDAEDSTDPWHDITPEKIEEAIAKIGDPSCDVKAAADYRDQITAAYADLDAGNIDGELADIIVQVAAYGEVIFG